MAMSRSPVFVGSVAAICSVAVAAGPLVSAAPARPGAEASQVATFPGDNGRLAYVLFKGRNADIHTALPDGRDPRRLTRTGVDMQPDWSATGSRILFKRTALGYAGDIWSMRPNGEEKELLFGGPIDASDPTWSPNGQRFAFVRGRFEPHLWTYNLRSEKLSRLTPVSRRVERAPAWSPNGRWIAFERDFQDAEYSEVWKVRPDGSGLRKVAGLRNRGVDSVDWSPNSKRLALGLWQFDERQSTEPAPGFAIMRADGKQRRLVNDRDGNDYSANPVWSPDGKLIAFEDSGAEAADGSFPDSGIWITTPNGQRQGLVVPDGNQPDWQTR